MDRNTDIESQGSEGTGDTPSLTRSTTQRGYGSRKDDIPRTQSGTQRTYGSKKDDMRRTPSTTQRVYGSQKERDEANMAFLTWKDLRLTVDGKRYILQGLSGCAEPGRLLAIMGPSGSGKSTLLDTLAGRPSRDTTVTGEILVNGHKANLSYGSAAYLAQDVVLLGTLTVYETLYYSAKLRFEDGMSETETRRVVMAAIEDVGLVDAINTPIGNWFRRGVSGGEKRRVSIAIELLTSPTLIFLDEPTSGLDSASSFHVIKTLKELGQSGRRTILCSIHQPSSEVFDLFDDLCLLSDGQQVYYGPLPQTLAFFERNGFPCPPLRSCADHYLHCVNSDFDTVERTLKRQSSAARSGRRVAALTEPPLRKTAKQAVQELVQSYKLSDEKSAVENRIELVTRTGGAYFEDKGSHASFLKQAVNLTMRSFLNMHRDIGYFWLRAVMYVIVAICLGTIYNDIGHNFNSIQARAAAFTFMVSFLSFMAIGGFPSFIEDMKVFHTERLNGHYRVGAFVVANTLSSAPFILMISGLTTAIVYPLVVFHGGFVYVLYFLLALYACLLVSESMMMAVSSCVSEFLLGIMLGAGVQGIYILVSGFFRLADDLPDPVWKYPLYYMSYVGYGFQGMMQNEFHGQTFRPMRQGDPPISGKSVVTSMYDVKNRSKWVNLAILGAMVLVYRTIFYLLLVGRENVFPAIGSCMYTRWLVLRAYSSKSSQMLWKTPGETSAPPLPEEVASQ
ncbi:unnamed protein product [Calypogeia fissa]